ncbi:MAG TPA: nuclear transport factor 2 family protein [Actinomycetota bacterium]|nr:nuclear transport factor 2 family protein [Actinomycetota bacterium]
MGVGAVESQVREAYEQLVAAFREGRVDDKFACFADEATVIDGTRWFGSLDEYRAAWDRWAAEHDGSAVLSVDTRIMKLQMLGDAAVLVHSIQARERTDSGEETVHERETIVFAKQPDGRWLVVHQHLSPVPD